MIYYYLMNKGSMSEWLKEADCKSVALCYVGSNPTRPNVNKNNYQNPVIFCMVKYNPKQNMIKLINNKIRSFGILNKFLNGAKITRINPAKLLIKNRGYLETFVQKSFIKYNY